MRTRRLLEATALAAVLLWPTFAWAGPGPGPGEAKFEEGVRAYEKGNYVEAAADFSAAYDASHNATHLWNLALAEIKAGHPYAALGDLTAYTMSPDANPQNMEHALQLIERMKKQVGHLAISAPEGTEIFVDGVSKGKTSRGSPFEVEVDPAMPHLVEGHLGQQVAHNNIPAPGAARVEVALDVHEEPTPPPPPPPPAPAMQSNIAPPFKSLEEADHVPKEGLLALLVVTETIGCAASTGLGVAFFMDGDHQNDPGKETLGAVLTGAGVALFAADILTMTLWPRSSRPQKPATSQVLISPSLGGLSLHGAF